MDKVNTCVGVSFYKKETPTQLFFVNIAIFLRTSFFIGHLRWLLLNNKEFFELACTLLYNQPELVPTLKVV